MREKRLGKETHFGRVRSQTRGDAGYQTHVSNEGTKLTGPEQTEAAQLRHKPQQFTSTKIMRKGHSCLRPGDVEVFYGNW